MSEERANYYTSSKKLRYAQGEVSKEFKDLLRNRLHGVKSEELEEILNDIHEATLICRNDPNGLRAAVKFLKDL